MFSLFIQNKFLRHYMHPGVLFCVANIFAFGQGSGSLLNPSPAALVAIITLLLALVFRALVLNPEKALLKLPPALNAMSVVALGALISGALATLEGQWLAAGAGLFFSIGNFLNAFPNLAALQHRKDVSAFQKALTHAAVYYGLGYACLGLMAGGFETMPSAITTVMGVSITSLATAGLALNIFTSPAAPFIAVAIGTGINTLSGLITGNIFGALSNFFAMLGESGLAYVFHKESIKTASAPEQKTGQNGFVAALSSFLEKPADFLVRKLS